jgi:hypothetical protein
MPIDADAIAEAERAGFDLSLVDASLGYDYTKRAEQHQAALELALELADAGRRLRGESQPTSRAPVRL